MKPPVRRVSYARAYSLCGFAVNLVLDIVVQVVVGAAVAVEPDVAGLDALGVDKFALGGLYIMHIFADAKAGRVVNIVIEQRPDVCDEVKVICDLHHYIEINSLLLKVVPNNDCVNAILGFKVDCDVLRKREQFDIPTTSGFFVAVCNHLEIAGYYFVAAAGDRLAESNVSCSDRSHEGRTRFAKRFLDVGHVERIPTACECGHW